MTASEDPEIRESAPGGPDTATRLQTVWQVKVLRDVGEADGARQSAAREEATAPSAGRLTARAAGPAGSGNPSGPPQGGYRGLENRLYRVEVHAPGPLGTARFKWSRDNGSVTSPVIAISASGTEVTVRSFGHPELRFQIDDWVEVLDDLAEFAGRPGCVARVEGIDDADGLLEVTGGDTDLEDGIRVRFGDDPTGGKLRTADH